MYSQQSQTQEVYHLCPTLHALFTVLFHYWNCALVFSPYFLHLTPFPFIFSLFPPLTVSTNFSTLKMEAATSSATPILCYILKCVASLSHHSENLVSHETQRVILCWGHDVFMNDEEICKLT
jgi:hypothetical protein